MLSRNFSAMAAVKSYQPEQRQLRASIYVSMSVFVFVCTFVGQRDGEVKDGVVSRIGRIS